METRTFGLKSVKMGDDSTALTALGDGKTLQGTASFNKEEDTSEEFFAEEQDAPIEEAATKGAAILEFATTDLTPATLVRVFGGEVVDDEWVEPEEAPVIFQAFEVITKKDVKITIDKARVKARIEWPLTKNDLGRVIVRAKAVGGFSIGKATAV